VPESLLPRDLDAFDAYVASMLGAGGPIRVSAVARELGQAVLRPPLEPLAPLLPFGPAASQVLARVPLATYGWTLWPAVGLLPVEVREAYGLRWGARERLVARWLVTAWRTWRPFLPESLRQMPQSIAADRRMRKGEPVS
jgi:uncharacterized protein (DUF2236 family)